MHVALVSPLPPEQNGIADYAEAFRRALEAEGVTVSTPLRGQPLACDPERLSSRMAAVDWGSFDLVHAELGGGRTGEFLALDWLSRHHPSLPLTATVHDPERLVWKPVRQPRWMSRLPRWLGRAAILLADPLTLATERRLARRLSRMVTLTRAGADGLARKLELGQERIHCIPHGNGAVPEAPMPPLPPRAPLKVLYFGFLYRGKGLEDLVDAVAHLKARRHGLARELELTLAGGTKPDLAFGHGESYVENLRKRWERSGLGDVRMDWALDVAEPRIPALVQAHHVMVLPYRDSALLSWLGRQRGTSGALSWAAACGRSVVSSDARAFAEEVSYGNGAVHPQGDSRALARELERLLDCPERIVERGACAARLGLERGWPRVAARFHDLFRQETVRRSAP